jgi:hypothetical protein
MLHQPPHSPLRRVRAVRAAVGIVWAGALALQMGCYSYLPVQSAPPADPKTERVAVVLNDRGRALLSERVGPLVEQIEGHIDKHENGVVTMAVYRVKNLRGDYSTWTGEQVQIPDDALLGYRPRKISKIKTALLVGGFVLALVASLRTSLDIFGPPPTERPPDGTPPNS